MINVAFCEVTISAITDQRALIGRFSQTSNTVLHFGFDSSTHFYDQIRYATGGAHVFIYHFRADLEDFFAELVASMYAS
jgi:hypothetical protein